MQYFVISTVFLLYGIFRYQALIFLAQMVFEVIAHSKKFENYQHCNEEVSIENDLQLWGKTAVRLKTFFTVYN